MAAIPLVLYRNHIFTTTTLNTMFLGFSFLATLFAVPLRLQVVNGKSPIMTGVLMLPMLGATGLGSVITAAVSSKKNKLSETLTAATMLVTIGLALETSVSDSPQLEPKLIGFLVLIGLGYGMITSAATMFTTLEAPIKEHGKSEIDPLVRSGKSQAKANELIRSRTAPAQGIIAQARMLGGSIGIAMSTALLAVQQRAQLSGIVSPAELQGLSYIFKDLPEAQQAAVRKTYNDAFTETMKVCAIVAGIGIVLSMGTYRRGRVSLSEQRQQMVRDEVARRRTEHDADRKGPDSPKSSGRSA